MKITIESTSEIVEIEGDGGGTLPARIWEGTTSLGTPVVVFVTRLFPPISADDPRRAEFDAELINAPEPTLSIKL